MKWKIWISGYGTYDFDGTEEEAEQSMRDKMRWERGNGQKWRADLARESDRLTAEIVGLWEIGAGVPKSLLQRRKAARLAELSSNS